MRTRRNFLIGLGAALAAGVSSVGYAFGVEPFRLRVKRYAFTPPRWTEGLSLKVALLADLHACDPWMSVEHIGHVVETTNALEPDLILLLGDYEARHKYVRALVAAAQWAPVLARLKAPLGVHAILGNHDWWDDPTAQRTGQDPQLRRTMEKAGLPVYENDVVRLEKDRRAFWLAGLGDQIALAPGRRRAYRQRFEGKDDLPGTLAKITDDAPVLLMAHEPDIFPRVPERVSLTMSGHTHGGQMRLFGYSPVVPSRYGNRFAYGHVVEKRAEDTAARHLVVSGGLGCSIIPVRFGMPPEIVLLELGTPSASS